MVPGLSIPDPESASSPNKPASESIASTAAMPKPLSSLASLQESLEDMRDAITDTDAYITLSGKATAVNRGATKCWRLSKRIAWLISTTALILVIPLLYEIDKELGPGFDPAAPITTPATPATDSNSEVAAAPAAEATAEATPAPAS